MAEREKPLLLRTQILDEQGKPAGMKTIRADQIRKGEKRQDLTPQQRDRATEMFERFGKRMLPFGLEKWLSNFERDATPDKEMGVWEAMNRVSERLWQHDASKPYTRKQVDHAVIAASVHAVDIPAQTGVSDAFVKLLDQMISEELQS